MTGAETDVCMRIESLIRMAVHSAMVRLTDRRYGATTLEDQCEIALHDIMEIVRMLVTKK
jgi:hypothetical protein